MPTFNIPTTIIRKPTLSEEELLRMVASLREKASGNPNPQPYHCNKCNDTSWVKHFCQPHKPCGRPFHDDPDTEPHEYVTRCTCYEHSPKFAHLFNQGERGMATPRFMKVLAWL